MEISRRLFEQPASMTKKELDALKKDERKGVQQLLLRWQRQQEQIGLEKKKYEEMSTYERELWEQGNRRRVAGVDEAGRGPLAGPVVAAAVILNEENPILGLNDSKQLTENKREKLYDEIFEKAAAVGIGIVSAAEIDEINIYQAAKRAMMSAVKSLQISPDHILVDAMNLPITIPQTSIVKGDCRSVSIAAGSIIAKVTRDRLMRKMHERFPQYGFSRNFGYATSEHLESIKKHGVCVEHRRSFAPVRDHEAG